MDLIKKKINHQIVKENLSFSLNDLKEGINTFKDVFIFKKKKNYSIYDRKCDHSGGKLMFNTSNKKISCPLRDWEFDIEKGCYKNISQAKKKLEFKIEKNYLHTKLNKEKILITKYKKKDNTKITFINHACLHVSSGKMNFAIDPWAIGPAFCNGWWLAKKSPKETFEILDKCDFIFISHNHPDHLHALTLSNIDKNKLILTPNFKSQSTSKYLKSLGFRNVKPLEFNYEYQNKEKNFSLVVLKSGDFRDDSGILFSTNDFTSLFTVDSNFLNFHNLPKDLTVLASSFAGGASAYPVCFDNFTNLKKKSIISRNLKSLKLLNQSVLINTKPKHFLPYAGFFKESKKYDIKIKKINKKNKILDYKIFCEKNKINLLNVDQHQIFEFSNNELKKKYKHTNFIKDQDEKFYYDITNKKYSSIEKEKIHNYFLNSNFTDNLILIIELTDRKRNENYIKFSVDFRNVSIKMKFNLENEICKDLKNLHLKTNARILNLNIRAEAFNEIIENKLPWEDLLIGFHCRVNRYPDIYNSNFWYHFTNKYITEGASRQKKDCNTCNAIVQRLDGINLS